MSDIRMTEEMEKIGTIDVCVCARVCDIVVDFCVLISQRTITKRP